jgi:hypothetical protein
VLVIGAIGIVVGAVISFWLFKSGLPEDTWRGYGALAGSWIGGNTVTIRSGGNVGRYRIVKVTATVENTGPLATHVARGANLAGNRQDVIWLIGNRDRIRFLQGRAYKRLGVIDGAMEIPGYDPSTAPLPSTPMQQFGGPPIDDEEEPQTGNTREVTWLLAVEGDTPLKLVLSSQKGGTLVRNLSIR